MSRRHLGRLRRKGIAVAALIIAAAALLTSRNAASAQQPQPQGSQSPSAQDSTTQSFLPPAESERVRAAVLLAMRVHQGVQAPLVSTAGVEPNDTDLQRQRVDGTKAIHAIFSDAPAAREVKALENVIEGQQTRRGSFSVLGGGINKIDYKSVTMSGATATVHATADAWSRMRIKAPDGTWSTNEPHNLLDITMTLKQDATKHWIVQTFSWTFAPGSAP